MEAKDSLINTLKAEVEADQVVIEQIKETNSKPAKPSESTTTIEPPKNCKPLQKLAFAKTHKTGGKYHFRKRYQTQYFSTKVLFTHRYT